MELSDEVKKFLFPGNENVEMFSHRTVSKEVADIIVKDGFKYYDSFQKTTDEVINDMVYLRYWDTLRKHYGAHIVVIAIDKDLLNRIQKDIQPRYEAQQVLSTLISGNLDVNSDEMKFLLPMQYVKGHIDRKTGEIIVNSEYNSAYTPPDLDKRIEELNEA